MIIAPKRLISLNHRDTEGTESTTERTIRVALGNSSRCWRARSNCHPALHSRNLCVSLC